MRRFSSYGQIDTRNNYYAPREELLAKAYRQLMGDAPGSGGHYITVWAPRQAGKSTVMKEILFQLREDERYDVLKIGLEHLKLSTDPLGIVQTVSDEILHRLGKNRIQLDEVQDFQFIFTRKILDKPLVLILDEFDALIQDAITGIVSVFRNIHLERQLDSAPSAEKEYLLHSVALIGVRSVLGIENKNGSPFNVQRGLHIPNLTFQEVEGMFKWYIEESGQQIEPEVIERIYYELQGQPGLTCWFGELLTEGYEDRENDLGRPIGLRDFEIVYAAATQILPNSNVLNILSKARQEPYKELVLDMFRTNEKMAFAYDDPSVNFLYMNGVVDREIVNGDQFYLKFPSPFIQKRIFNHFSRQIFRQLGQLVEPFVSLDDVISSEEMFIRPLMRRYQAYLQKNGDWLFKNAPRRSDLRIYEAVFHFNLYEYLVSFLRSKGAEVWPEFPTGNGKIDVFIKYRERIYGLELKSFSDLSAYTNALRQAAAYGQQLDLEQISLIFFIEAIDEENRAKYEAEYLDEKTGVSVQPIFVATGN